MKKLEAKVSIKKINDVLTVIASDETLDRHGEVLPIDSWDISKFNNAPRMLVDHDHRVEKIVGKWANARIEGKQLLMEPVFHNFTELAKAVQEMVQEGFLDTVSVGFIPHGPEKDGDRDTFELIETSWVTVPANHNARIMKALEVAPTKEALKEIENFTGKKIVDMTLEAMEKMGWKICKSIEDYEAWKKEYEPHGIGLALCEAQFIEKLVEDSKQLKTLTASYQELEKVVASKEKQSKKMLQIALREVAKTVNDALRKNNHRSL